MSVVKRDSVPQHLKDTFHTDFPHFMSHSGSRLGYGELRRIGMPLPLGLIGLPRVRLVIQHLTQVPGYAGGLLPAVWGDRVSGDRVWKDIMDERYG